MGLTSFKVLPANTADWDRFFRSVPVTPDPNSVGTMELKAGAVATVNIQDAAVTTPKHADGSVTNVKLAPAPALSVKGRALNTDGVPVDIAAAADGNFLVRRGAQLVFDPLLDADIPATIARDTEITDAINALLATSDPFPQYETQAEGDARYVLQSTVLNGSATYDPPSLGDGAGATTTVTVTGAALGDFALASFSLDLQGITVTCYVSAADTVAVRFQNESGGSLDLSSGTLKARVWK